MALPKGDQYNEAVQSPHVSFDDTELKSAKVETGMFGLPKPYSGGFTVTFKLQSNYNSCTGVAAKVSGHNRLFYNKIFPVLH